MGTVWEHHTFGESVFLSEHMPLPSANVILNVRALQPVCTGSELSETVLVPYFHKIRSEAKVGQANEVRNLWSSLVYSGFFITLT